MLFESCVVYSAVSSIIQGFLPCYLRVVLFIQLLVVLYKVSYHVI